MRLNGINYVGIGWKPNEGVVRECNAEIPRYLPVGKIGLRDIPNKTKSSLSLSHTHAHTLSHAHTHAHTQQHTHMYAGSHPLWQFPLSFPMVEGADVFYNQLVGINSTYSPPSDEKGNGGWSGKNLPIHTIHAFALTNTQVSTPWTAQTLS